MCLKFVQQNWPDVLRAPKSDERFAGDREERRGGRRPQLYDLCCLRLTRFGQPFYAAVVNPYLPFVDQEKQHNEAKTFIL